MYPSFSSVDDDDDDGLSNVTSRRSAGARIAFSLRLNKGIRRRIRR